MKTGKAKTLASVVAIMMLYAFSAQAQHTLERTDSTLGIAASVQKGGSGLAGPALQGQALSFRTDKGGAYAVSYDPVSDSVGLQFDLYASDIASSDISCGDGYPSKFVVDCTVHKESNFVRVIVFSLSNQELVAGDLVSVRSGAGTQLQSIEGNQASLSLSNVKIADRSSRDITPEGLR